MLPPGDEEDAAGGEREDPGPQQQGALLEHFLNLLFREVPPKPALRKSPVDVAVSHGNAVVRACPVRRFPREVGKFLPVGAELVLPAGKLGPGIILGWWLAWSTYELVVRMFCKPYVKEGPWWGRRFRPATWADMISYVGMKNLLIGAGLFLLMKGIGVLGFLHGLPQLKWLY